MLRTATILVFLALLAPATSIASEHGFVVRPVHDDVPRSPSVPPRPTDTRLRDPLGGDIWVAAETLITSLMIKAAMPAFDSQTERPVVQVWLNPDGAKILEAYSTAHVGTRLALILDGRVVTAPVIQAPLPGDKFTISGNFTLEDAHSLAAQIDPAGNSLPKQ